MDKGLKDVLAIVGLVTLVVGVILWLVTTPYLAEMGYPHSQSLWVLMDVPFGTTVWWFFVLRIFALCLGGFGVVSLLIFAVTKNTVE